MRLRHLPFLIALCAVPAAAAPLVADKIAQLRADLAGPESATQVLTRWCAARQVSPPAIRAIRAANAAKPADDQVRALLKAAPGQTVRYRQVRLMCGDQVFSEADNWYLPDDLTAAMNQTLDTTDTSFGTVVQPLDFHRQTLGMTDDAGGDFVLHVRALLVTGQGTPFSLVVENYRRTLVSP
jgi:hypothetical protein